MVKAFVAGFFICHTTNILSCKFEVVHWIRASLSSLFLMEILFLQDFLLWNLPSPFRMISEFILLPFSSETMNSKCFLTWVWKIYVSEIVFWKIPLSLSSFVEIIITLGLWFVNTIFEIYLNYFSSLFLFCNCQNILSFCPVRNIAARFGRIIICVHFPSHGYIQKKLLLYIRKTTKIPIFWPFWEPIFRYRTKIVHNTLALHENKGIVT